jgi:uracil-DNA glycosylase
MARAKESDPQPSAAALIPPRAGLHELRRIAAGCKACHLWKHATQTVFGDGPINARLLLIGEQPGNDEDLQGKPFVGPAGHLLDKALESAGIERSQVYVTNVVKHFKWEPRGKRRIHAKPDSDEIAACRAWLDAEIARVKPYAVVCLGATAAQTIFGKQFRVTKQRGEFLTSELAPIISATIHPSAILRAITEEDRKHEMSLFVRDLRKISKALKTSKDRTRTKKVLGKV